MELNIRVIEEFEQALLGMNRIKAAEIFEEVFSSNQSLETLEQLTIKTLERIGKGWEDGQLSLSQVYMSGAICEGLVDQYLPESLEDNRIELKVAIGVLQDHHALGKRIVYSILRASGYDLIDFGQGLSVEEIVEKSINEKIDVLLISTLMLHSALKVKKVVEMFKERKAKIKVIVGGAPFRLDNKLWKRVDAEADGINGIEVQKILKSFSEGGKQS